MRKDKEKITRLRSSGKSYSEISRLYSIPKSTLSAWFKDHKWSKDIAQQLIKKSQKRSSIVLRELSIIRGEHLKKLYNQAEIEAKEEFELLKYHPLFIAAMMIYWGEGDKLSKSRISIANTEPRMLRVFVYFLKNICGFKNDKIRAWVLAYPDMDIESSKQYWITNTSLNGSNFRKTIIIHGKLTKRKLSNGVCTIELSSTYFKIKMLIWLHCFSETLITDEYYAGVV